MWPLLGEALATVPAPQGWEWTPRDTAGPEVPSQGPGLVSHRIPWETAGGTALSPTRVAPPITAGDTWALSPKGTRVE